MGWDPETNTVTASEEVWDSYLKKYPTAKRYRKKGLPHYNILGIIFNNTTATGEMSYASTQLPPSANDERQQERHFVGTGTHVDIGTEFDREYEDERVEEITGVRRRAVTARLDAPRPKEKKKQRSSIIL
ncbi:hypothetical protein TorRG33x02_026310 [Trema orientale]|uniref:Myb/SANT-like domain containing protein n=1 Tax=Trema orientale TaxID=63057 RepID=A0A2P5FVN3_TREOI|nr:hypothetical protein TorRG33x02_026310 [Trema orientale]